MIKIICLIILLVFSSLISGCGNVCEHVYDNKNDCQDKKCIIEGCGYIEKATAQHNYTPEYICSYCNTPKTCTLEILGRDFSTQILEQARKNAGDLVGKAEIVVLNAQDTILHIQNYIFSPQIDTSKITGGLFVKFDVNLNSEETIFTVYYNFALQFSEEQTNDIEVSLDQGNETWYLEVVEGNKTILFEYSIT